MSTNTSPDPDRDADFARVALPLLPAVARVATALTHDRYAIAGSTLPSTSGVSHGARR